MARPAGVFTEDGQFCDDAMTYRVASRPATVQPEFSAADEVKKLLRGQFYLGA